VPITAVGLLSIICLTDMKLIVVPGIEPDLVAMDGGRYTFVLSVFGYKTSLILENCTFEATFDSPVLDRLVGCTAEEGAQVSLWTQHLVVVQCLNIPVCIKHH
jgi:hypothetical protein